MGGPLEFTHVGLNLPPYPWTVICVCLCDFSLLYPLNLLYHPAYFFY